MENDTLDRLAQLEDTIKKIVTWAQENPSNGLLDVFDGTSYYGYYEDPRFQD